uniref:CSD domain-containing protein n=1 Tax=Timema tahoe TaxID=61484 RepID=A0A7R9NWI3_9NEOP|nr:unnamed protein product [Timema tahoe]
MNNRNDSAYSDEEGERMELSEKLIPTSTQAMDPIEELRRFIEGQHNVNPSILQALNKLEESIFTGAFYFEQTEQAEHPKRARRNDTSEYYEYSDHLLVLDLFPPILPRTGQMELSLKMDLIVEADAVMCADNEMSLDLQHFQNCEDTFIEEIVAKHLETTEKQENDDNETPKQVTNQDASKYIAGLRCYFMQEGNEGIPHSFISTRYLHRLCTGAVNKKNIVTQTDVSQLTGIHCISINLKHSAAHSIATNTQNGQNRYENTYPLSTVHVDNKHALFHCVPLQILPVEDHVMHSQMRHTNCREHRTGNRSSLHAGAPHRIESSANPRVLPSPCYPYTKWKSFQSPAMNSDSAILDYKPLTITSNSTATPNFHNLSNGTHFNSGNNHYQDLQSSPKEIPNNLYSSKASSSNSYSPQYDSYSSSNNSRGGGRFPIGTFTGNEGSSNIYNGDTMSSPTVSNANNSTNNSSYNDSSQNNQGTRETGIIEKLLHSYGFIQCCERQARLFFHFSQFNGNIEHLKIGDPVEFEMTYDRRTGKPIASAVTKIAPEVVLSEERVTGTVTTELRAEGSGGDTQGRISYENRGECFFLPYNKDDVEGNVTLCSGDKCFFVKSGNLGACHIRLENPAHPVKYQGVICSMKESFGFIERADVVKEIFFHFSEAKTVKDELRLGDDVEFIIQTRNVIRASLSSAAEDGEIEVRISLSSAAEDGEIEGKEVACNITRLEAGSVVFEDVCTEVVKGQVLKPLERGQQARQHQNDPLPGRIRYRAPDHSEVEIPFGDKDQRGDFTLKHGDWVQFRIATDRRDQLQRATNISLQEESFNVSGERREQGAVVALKEGFGFIRCAERESRLFFHFNEVLDVDRDICINDEVEFTIVQEQTSFSNSRQSAIRIKHLPTGTVQFEVVIEKNVSGVISKEIPPQNGNFGTRSPTKTNSQISYSEN